MALLLNEFLPRFFPKTSTCIFYRQYLDMPFQITDKEYPVPLDDAVSAVSNTRDFSIIEHSAATNELQILFPFFSKKKPVVIAVISMKKKKIKEYEDKARELFLFLKDHFSHLKQIRKQFLHLETDIESRKFDSLRKFLSTKKTFNRKYITKHIVNPASKSLCTSDFANVYKTQTDKILFCLSDITSNTAIRHEALTLIDASVTILSKTDIPFSKYLAVLNNLLCDKLTACYVSISCALYDEKEHILELCGAGSCIALLYQHDIGEIKRFNYGDPLGALRGNTPETVSIQISAGDILFICSDGLVDNKKINGQAYGLEFIQNILNKNCRLPVFDQAEMIEKAYLEILDEDELFDDCSFQICKFE